MQKQKIDVVFFDCDSTLVKVEGLDEMAKMAGCYDKIKDLTKKSMDGDLPYEEILRKKFEMIRPSIPMLLKLGEIYKKSLVEDAKEVVEILHELGKEVYIVTGEIKESVAVLASHLKIPESRIIVNEADFDYSGNFTRMRDGPLMRDDGKAEVLKKLDLHRKRSAFVGDGFPDSKAKEVVNFFIGYGGVAYREKVKAVSDEYLVSESLFPLLDILLTRNEIKTYKQPSQTKR